MKHVGILIALLLLPLAVAQDLGDLESRIWTSTRSTTIEGVLVGIDGDQVSIRSKDGRVIKVNLELLSIQDQEYIEDFRKENRLPLAVAYVGSIDRYWARSMREAAAAAGRKLELMEILVGNLTNSSDRKRGETVLRYGADQLEAFFEQHGEGAERHIVLFASHSILAHAKLAREYGREVEKFRNFGEKNSITLHVFDSGPLPSSSTVRNFDDVGRTPDEANSAMEVFLRDLEGWDVISMPAVRKACAERLKEHSKFSWQGPLPDYVMSAVVLSSITDEKPPLLPLKEAVLRKTGMEDPVVANPANDGMINQVITTTSNENLRGLSALIDEVVNP